MRIALLSIVCTLAGMALGHYGDERGNSNNRNFPWLGASGNDEWEQEDRFDQLTEEGFQNDHYLVAELDDPESMDQLEQGWDDVELNVTPYNELSMRDDDDRGPPPHERGFRGPGRGNGPPPQFGRRPPRREADDDEHEDDCPFCERLRDLHRRHFAARSDREDCGNVPHRPAQGRGMGLHRRGMGRHAPGNHGRQGHGQGCLMCEERSRFDHPPHHGRRHFSNRQHQRGRDEFGHGCPMCGGGGGRGSRWSHNERHFQEWRGDGGFPHRTHGHRVRRGHHQNGNSHRGSGCPHCRQERMDRGRHHNGGALHEREHMAQGGNKRHGGNRMPEPHRFGGPGLRGPQHIFQMLDSDHDGKLSKDEVLKLHAAQDADHDGYVTIEEVGRHLEKVHKHPHDGRHVPKSDGDKPKSKRDEAVEHKGVEKSNADGKPKMGHPGRGLGVPKGMPGREMMGMLREHGFGGRFPMAPPHEIMEQIFDKIDADHNGSLTKEEIAEAIWKRAVAADDNKDGALSKDETRKHIRTHLQRMGEGRPDRRPGGAERRPGGKPGKPEGRGKPKPPKSQAEVTTEPPASAETESQPEEDGKVQASSNQEIAPDSSKSDENVKPVIETAGAAEASASDSKPADQTTAGSAEEAKPEITEPMPTVLPSVEQEKPTENPEPENGSTSSS